MALKAKKYNINVNILDVPAGKQDFSACMSINKAIIRFAREGVHNIVIDFHSCSDLDNIFVDMLLSAGKYCDKTGCRLSLSGMEPDVLCAFYLLKLDRHFEFYETAEDAFYGRNRLVKRAFRCISGK
jgi:anti-anti-sigma regulatory factor